MVLDESMVRLEIEAGRWVEPARLIEAVRDAGFTPVPEGVHLLLAGTLRRSEGKFRIELGGMKTPRELACVPGGPPIQDALEDHGEGDVVLRARWLPEREAAVEVLELLPPSP